MAENEDNCSLAEYVVVGAGLTGATVAWCLRNAGREVIVLEQRNHIAGNCYDERHALSEFRYQPYGPHAFRTDNAELWTWLNEFVPFSKFELHVKSWVAGRAEVWPPSEDYMNSHFGAAWQPAQQGPGRNFEEAALAQMPRKVYDLFVRPYSEKHWGRPASHLWPELVDRFRIGRADNRISSKRFQGLPSAGYTTLVEKMLAGIPVRLGVVYRASRDRPARQKIVYTGPLDDYFGRAFGLLSYRSMRYKHQWFPGSAPLQDVPIWNYPSPNIHKIRSIDWHYWQTDLETPIRNGTLITTAFAFEAREPIDYAYPIRTASNLRRYKLYRKIADQETALGRAYFGGRLADYRYLDMDEAILCGLRIAHAILGADYRGPDAWSG